MRLRHQAPGVRFAPFNGGGCLFMDFAPIFPVSTASRRSGVLVTIMRDGPICMHTHPEPRMSLTSRNARPYLA